MLLADFLNMTFIDMVNYCEYIFVKISKILNNIITYFQLYEIYRIQIDNLTSPFFNILIEVGDVLSDIDICDINFIIEKI